jgi:hypothetical protein
MFGETEKAIAGLHILNNEFPKEKNLALWQVLILMPILLTWRRNIAQRH